jgi:hypothetical protein
VADQRFDLITTNPPYVMSPPAGGRRLTYRESERVSDGLVERIVRDGPSHLNDGGVLQILGNWAHPTGGSWQDRLAGWIAPAGCDAHVVQREVLDAGEYAELWLADAGLVGAPTYRRRYAEWLDYFESLGIEAVGLGWITLHRTGRDVPDVRMEHWPYAIEEPIAPALGYGLEAVDLSHRWSDADLLTQTLLVADHVVEERTGMPGAADPQHIVLRQQRGYRRATEVDAALAGVVGACDGELSLDLILAAVASLVDSDADELRAHLLPRVRTLLVEGFLVAERV